MHLRLWPVVAVCLFPIVVWGWLPDVEEFEILCQQSQWKEDALPLLAESDEAIRQWLWQPMDDQGNTLIHICAEEGNPGLLLQLGCFAVSANLGIDWWCVGGNHKYPNLWKPIF